LLVWYKREFDWSDVLRLWEGLWTDYLSSGFALFVALAILEKHRDIIMVHLQHFDEVLKYVNELSQTMDLESTLIRAEALFKRFQRVVDAIDKKSNFPAPKLRQRPTARGESRSSSSLGSSFVDVSTNNSATGADIPSGSASNAETIPTSLNGKDTTSGGKQKQKQSVSQALQEMRAKEKENEKEKVVSPELRALLSREVAVLPRKVVKKSGEGLASMGGKK